MVAKKKIEPTNYGFSVYRLRSILMKTMGSAGELNDKEGELIECMIMLETEV